MNAWATHAGLDFEDLAIEVHWTFAENPHRVDAMHLTFEWPSLPQKRYAAARRVSAAAKCSEALPHMVGSGIAGTGGSGAAAASARWSRAMST